MSPGGPPRPDPAAGAEARRRTLYLAAVGILVLYLAYLARTAVVPLLIALLAAYVLAPLVAALQRRRFSRIGAVTTLFLAFFGSLGLAGTFGLPPLVQEIRSLARAAVGEPARTLGMRLPGELQLVVDESMGEGAKRLTFAVLVRMAGDLVEAGGPDLLGSEEERQRGNFERRMREIRETRGPEEARAFKESHDAWLVTRHEGRLVLYDDRNRNGRFDAGYVFDAAVVGSRWVNERFSNPELSDAVEDLGQEVFPRLSEAILVNTSDVARGALGVLGTMLALLTWSLIVPLYTFFFLMHLEEVWKAFVTHLPGTHRDRVLRVLHSIHVMLIGFFRGRLLTMLFKGIMVAAGLLVVGAPYWVVFGALAGVLTIVPAVGPLAAGLPAVILSYNEGGPVTAGLAAAVLVAAELVEGYVLIPKMVGREVGLHPMAVITAILVGGGLLGLFGVVIAIPLAAAARIVWGEFVVPALEAKAAEPAAEDPTDLLA